MNLFPEKKAKENLVEVIYATLDGNIYFYDLDDGSFTRNSINVGMNFKGAGALDPRGYPLMYVGSGDSIGSKVPRMYVISLIDGSILYERSGNDAFSQRDWTAFDSSPLVDKETDTLIWPGENGILYTIKLNTVYDQSAGTITVAPEEIVKTRYSTDRSNKNTYWVGYEPSAVIVDRYLYIFLGDILELLRHEFLQRSALTASILSNRGRGKYIAFTLDVAIIRFSQSHITCGCSFLLSCH